MLRAGKETKKDGWNNSVQEIGPAFLLFVSFLWGHRCAFSSFVVSFWFLIM